jgi:hypothetical protein
LPPHEASARVGSKRAARAPNDSVEIDGRPRKRRRCGRRFCRRRRRRRTGGLGSRSAAAVATAGDRNGHHGTPEPLPRPFHHRRTFRMNPNHSISRPPQHRLPLHSWRTQRSASSCRRPPYRSERETAGDEGTVALPPFVSWHAFVVPSNAASASNKEATGARMGAKSSAPRRRATILGSASG